MPLAEKLTYGSLVTTTRVNSFCAGFIKENIKYICTFYHFSTLWWHRLLKFLQVNDNDLFILHTLCCCCWWPGDTSHQGISSNGIDLVILEYSNFSTRVNFFQGILTQPLSYQCRGIVPIVGLTNPVRSKPICYGTKANTEKYDYLATSVEAWPAV